MNLSEDKIVELGVRAELLLQSQTFQFVVNFLKEAYTDTMTLSRPEEKQVRESAYFHHRALSDIYAQLGSFVDQKDGIVQARIEREQQDND